MILLQRQDGVPITFGKKPGVIKLKKRLIGKTQPMDASTQKNWLDVTDLVEVEISSEDAAHPIESALLPEGKGWRAAEPGNQTIRLIFAAPQNIEQIYLCFHEADIERTQEYVLRWSPDGGRSFQHITRQQWNFSPSGATSETEHHDVHLTGVTVLELNITPDISGNHALASIAQFRIA